jgi:hypothetical protein
MSRSGLGVAFKDVASFSLKTIETGRAALDDQRSGCLAWDDGKVTSMSDADFMLNILKDGARVHDRRDPCLQRARTRLRADRSLESGRASQARPLDHHSLPRPQERPLHLCVPPGGVA